MRKIGCLAIGIFLVLCEASFFSFLPLEITKPNLGVPFIIYAIFFLPAFDALLAAGLFGLIMEFLSAGPPGSILFANFALLLSCLFLKSRLYIESRYTFCLVCAASVLFQAFVFIAVSLLAKGETKDISNVLLYCLPDSIVTGFIALFLFGLFERLKVRYPSWG
jgi:cell shape-determining protein MreD